MTSLDHLGPAVAPTTRRRLRRIAAVAVSATLALTLAACGSDDSSILDEYSGAKGFDAVSISGDPGKEPQVEWKEGLHADKLQTETLVEGDGKEVKDGEKVYLQLWIGNGFSKSVGYTTYGEEVQPVTAGPELGDVIGPLVNGQKVGSRVAVIADPKSALEGQIGPQFGVGDGDSALIIGDVVGTLLDGPDGAKAQPAPWAPKVVEKTVKKVKQPASLDFAGTPAPTKALQKTFLIRGSGAPVKDGQTITVNYLGQVYQGKEPFDGSYSKGEPFSFKMGKDATVVDGWKQGLKGVPVGSRIILAVPPKLGYGKDGKPDANIKGTDTMYFLVDVLGAA